MVNALIVDNTAASSVDSWEATAKRLFNQQAVGVMTKTRGGYTIFARVVGFVDDPTFGRLLEIEGVDTKGLPIMKCESKTPPKDPIRWKEGKE